MATFKELKFKPEEFALIYRQVAKLYDHKNKTSPRQVRRKEEEYKLLKAIHNRMEPIVKASNINTLEYKMNMPRTELRALQSIAILGRRLLNEKIVPGYEERMAKVRTDENMTEAQLIELEKRFSDYLDKARQTEELYANILTIVEGAL